MAALFHANDRKPLVAPLEVWPDIGAAAATALADEPRFEIRKPQIVRPSIRIQSDVVAAMAIDQHAAQSHLSHLAEGDLELPAVGVRRRVALVAGHAAIEAVRRPESNCRLVVAQNARELLRVVGVEKHASDSVL
ncbi:hypothetical protein [Bradyrhizobium sp. AZCC 2230]|uniref:hypothetical protein n=1 Tax=Bradyrhizobium sp. AZCC 2230 TaxID=3117021 RepID=UPI002FF1D3CA